MDVLEGCRLSANSNKAIAHHLSVCNAIIWIGGRDPRSIVHMMPPHDGLPFGRSLPNTVPAATSSPSASYPELCMFSRVESPIRSAAHLAAPAATGGREVREGFHHTTKHSTQTPCHGRPNVTNVNLHSDRIAETAITPTKSPQHRVPDREGTAKGAKDARTFGAAGAITGPLRPLRHFAGYCVQRAACSVQRAACMLSAATANGLWLPCHPVNCKNAQRLSLIARGDDKTGRSLFDRR
ncbi:hypothetical protein CKAH01_10775 [Colletotrichum kahawae]|uniref:Uncharacterized protein n=1 Tax=Colletotrichum kahawae TaxID=34407 RepID=A0AAD9XW37_COLKA|nr:hypothetical protein CKAH01_10775 [Colletotrichum kahawae]